MDRRDILLHACELYHAGGLEAVSMRRLAGSLGVTAPALYRHYPSREEILLDVVREAYRLCAESLSEALMASTPAERFRRAGHAYLEFALAHPKLYEMLYIPAHALGRSDFPEDLTARIAGVGQFFDDRVRECVSAGLLHAEDPQGIAVTLWAHAHGLISIYLRGCLSMDEDAFRQVYTESCRRALLGTATPAYAAALAAPDASLAVPGGA